MNRTRPKVVLQAHATRSLTALALLLHARDRGPRDLRNPLGTLLASFVVAVVIVVAVAVAGRVGALIGHQDRTHHRAAIAHRLTRVERWLRDRHRILGPALIMCGILLVPWLLYLSIKLPNTARARNWALMWTGVDVAESIGLILTGVLQWRRTPRRALPAAFTSALIAMDAWVDVTTSAPSHGRTLAIILAVCVEVPAAVVCLLIALHTTAGAPPPANEDKIQSAVP